jgi:RND superfamily putative drug exporter
MDIDESIGRTNATAGQGRGGRRWHGGGRHPRPATRGIPFVAALGYSASIVVAVAVLVAITLLPALLGVRR